jgi:hypothetical protein
MKQCDWMCRYAHNSNKIQSIRNKLSNNASSPVLWDFFLRCLLWRKFVIGWRWGSKVSNSDYGLDNRRIMKIFPLERSSSVFTLALWPTQALIQWVPGPLWAYRGWVMKLTTHLHLVLRLRMSGAIRLASHKYLRVHNEKFNLVAFDIF